MGLILVEYQRKGGKVKVTLWKRKSPKKAIKRATPGKERKNLICEEEVI